MDFEFLNHVREGLSDNPKHLSSRFFYDKKGDKLFQEIMNLDAYYLTRSEHEILTSYKQEILEELDHGEGPLQLVEFGAGDGYKTKVLLKHFLAQGADFKYLPVDISVNALELLMQDLDDEFPQLNGQSINNEYFAALNSLKGIHLPVAVLFLGSNIGNFRFDEAIRFLSDMANSMEKNDRAMIGFDLKKDPEVIKRAYNDEEGVTRDFNLNLLVRINRELDGEFDLERFSHDPEYDEETGEARSYLKSEEDQDVYIGALNTSIHFEKGERIFTEVSKKYDLNEIEALARESGFEIAENFFDSKNYFVDSVWRRL